ncbi:hypothetical protein [Arachidicoccus soli]|uniref:Uncharacterized protein n=1 Tax=Arachidicoccus soli TaxID=2341117 RepID=A0A386HKC0_9BACT|nr:hypothetical protein [Arachidicoccus soli]AYD46328.1 hypothetical protein D6B99_01040 [Arachidicoccus soli]
MSNLIHSLQEDLGLPHFLRVSPNTQDVKASKVKDRSALLGQACITSVLLGLYQYTRDIDNAVCLLKPKQKGTWLEVIFNRYPEALEHRIVHYTETNSEKVREYLSRTADKAVEEVQTHLGPKATGEDVKHYMSNQRNHILSFLPSELRAGESVNNTSLDDASNKMHGPFSDFMHWFEEFFADSQKPLY